MTTKATFKVNWADEAAGALKDKWRLTDVQEKIVAKELARLSESTLTLVALSLRGDSPEFPLGMTG